MNTFVVLAALCSAAAHADKPVRGIVYSVQPVASIETIQAGAGFPDVSRVSPAPRAVIVSVRLPNGNFYQFQAAPWDGWAVRRRVWVQPSGCTDFAPQRAG